MITLKLCLNFFLSFFLFSRLHVFNVPIPFSKVASWLAKSRYNKKPFVTLELSQLS